MNPGPLKRAHRSQLKLLRRRLTVTCGWELSPDCIASMASASNFSARRFGDQLPSTNVSALFAPPTGGLWIGYRFGGFSFLKNGKLTNFRVPFPTGTVQGFAQDRHGIVWAASTRGVWRFDGSSWQQNPAEWNPQLSAAQVGFDRDGILWVLTDRRSLEFGRQLFYLLPDGSEISKGRR